MTLTISIEHPEVISLEDFKQVSENTFINSNGDTAIVISIDKVIIFRNNQK
jgi:hypothetical protein